MKVHLLYADRDVEAVEIPRNRQAALDTLALHVDSVTREVVSDLDLETLWQAMAGDDEVVLLAVRQTMLAGPATVDEVHYRQDVLADCLANSDVVRRLYAIACQALEGERGIYRGFFSDHGEGLLTRSVQVVQMLLDVLRTLRRLGEEHAASFRSTGFTRFFAELEDQLDDAYFAEVEEHLSMLHFKGGLVLSARLGAGNQSTAYVLRRPNPENRSGWFTTKSVLRKPNHGFTIPDRDESSFRALGELRDRGLDIVAAGLGEAAEHVLSYFRALRTEVGFYVGALTLHDRLRALDAPVTFPEVHEPSDPRLRARDLYDPCLALHLGRRAVGNDLDADDARLVVVTGANQGGKSTFLRSLGIAHLMARSGLFVPASELATGLAAGIYTHFRREEDATMTSGKFDEELARMSLIADRIGPGSVLLGNESFGATNEREGSDIATDVIDALEDSGVRVVIVTHMYDLAHRYEVRARPGTVFLRADRNDDGSRGYRLSVAPPLPTSFGEDVYRAVFADA
ncbi:putative DNA mismatch repair protein [Nostocoides japonicum T1-X7]|uniref:Putative DNA mismatch repair protein n=1 Tax=Nostocoides japonicum T1-X7 TaxID=1194083 RepID=A0A077LT02_9MICO|nr:hypothetical protein [Tetrasphaera japonica]CCH76051.1 putative DNA mismatch repair protein [Tetrasphaera japonica T1-X7]